MNSKSIMKKIENGEVKMKPKWWFKTIETSTKITWIGMVLLTSLSIMAIVSFWEIYNPVEIGGFGEVGRELLLEDFPYMWAFFATFGIIVSGVVNGYVGENYLKDKRVIIRNTIVITLITTLILYWLLKMSVVV